MFARDLSCYSAVICILANIRRTGIVVEVTLDLLVSRSRSGRGRLLRLICAGVFSPRMPGGAKVISLFVLATAAFFPAWSG